MRVNTRLTIVTILMLGMMIFNIASASTQTFLWTMKTIEKKGSGWTFKYTYPELSAPEGLMGVRGIARDFNDKIQQNVKNEQKTFMEAVKRLPSPPSPKLISEHKVKCTSFEKTPKYASFKFEHFEMIAGMAHPETTYSTINWASNGTFLSLDDLFIPGKNYLQRLSDESGKKLKQKFAKESSDLIPAGWAPRAENFNLFRISRKGLYICFSYYQVGPRTFGAPEILIPWKSIDDILSPQIKDMLKG